MPGWNEKGVLTVDFIFALTLVFGLFGILLALSLTLATVEFTQYITFASARNYFTAHFTEQHQRAVALDKFNQLIQDTPAFASLYQNGWFSIEDPVIGNFNDQFPQDPNSGSDTFHGTEALLTAHMLDIRVPGFGSTSSGDGDGFQANIRSYLSREPTSQECLGFNQVRWQLLQAVHGFSSGGSVEPKVISDNGC